MRGQNFKLIRHPFAKKVATFNMKTSVAVTKISLSHFLVVGPHGNAIVIVGKISFLFSTHAVSNANDHIVVFKTVQNF